MKTRRAFLLVSALAVTSCSSSSSPSPTPTSQDLATYHLDLTQFSAEGPLRLANASLAFRPDLGTLEKKVTGEDDSFRSVYNRLPCQGAVDSIHNDELADQGFRNAGVVASRPPVRIESVSLEMPDDPQTSIPISEICFAYHTADGKWHGHFEGVPTTRDDTAKLSRATLQVAADDVDVVGVVIYTGLVSAISFVARQE